MDNFLGFFPEKYFPMTNYIKTFVAAYLHLIAFSLFKMTSKCNLGLGVMNDISLSNIFVRYVTSNPILELTMSQSFSFSNLQVKVSQSKTKGIIKTQLKI